MFSGREALITFLNRLTEKGVTPDYIKISTSTFGSDVFYYHEQKIEVYSTWAERNPEQQASLDKALGKEEKNINIKK